MTRSESEFGQLIADEQAESPYERAVEILTNEALREALENLSYRERRVLELRYGLGDQHPRTLDEVGRAFNVTRERIRQIEHQSLKKLHTSARPSSCATMSRPLPCARTILSRSRETLGTRARPRGEVHFSHGPCISTLWRTARSIMRRRRAGGPYRSGPFRSEDRDRHAGAHVCRRRRRSPAGSSWATTSQARVQSSPRSNE